MKFWICILLAEPVIVLFGIFLGLGFPAILLMYVIFLLIAIVERKRFVL